MRGYHPRSRNYRDDPEVEHYIPNYDRDGYKPGPRYKHRNERNAPQFAIGGYSMMGKQHKYIYNYFVKILTSHYRHDECSHDGSGMGQSTKVKRF